MARSFGRIVSVYVVMTFTAVVSADDAKPGGHDEAFVSAMRALPSVYRVFGLGDGKMSLPVSVSFNSELLDADYESAKTQNRIPAGMAVVEFKWRAIGENPDRYLKASDAREESTFTGMPLVVGTAFAINRDGYLLTNRHVVGRVEGAPIDMEIIRGDPPKCLINLVGELGQKIGDWTSDQATAYAIFDALAGWIGQTSKADAEITGALVVLAAAEPTPAAITAEGEAAKFLSKVLKIDSRKPMTVTAKVVAKGGEGLPSDVAILRIDANVRDALICVPLADAGAAKHGDAILSLGFPMYRYADTRMGITELSSVTVEKGAIDWLPSPGGLPLNRRLKARTRGLDDEAQNLVVVTAKIRPGSSGGPVILRDGRAIAINVAYQLDPDIPADRVTLFGRPAAPKPKRESYDFAVSIETARKMLAEQGIGTDTGPTTAHWYDALADYEAGRYEEALKKFREVQKRQVLRPVGKPYGPTAPAPIDISGHYVQQMIDLATRGGRAAP